MGDCYTSKLYNFLTHDTEENLKKENHKHIENIKCNGIISKDIKC